MEYAFSIDALISVRAKIIPLRLSEVGGERGAAIRDPVGNNWYIATHTGR